jgi:hypothetical protein
MVKEDIFYHFTNYFCRDMHRNYFRLDHFRGGSFFFPELVLTGCGEE